MLGLNKPTKELIGTMTLTPQKVPLERRDREGWMRVKSKNSVLQGVMLTETPSRTSTQGDPKQKRQYRAQEPVGPNSLG